MGINIGLDIGAISLKLAALGKPGDRAILEALCAAHPDFRLAELGGRPLVLSEYRRIAGSPIQSTYDLLQEFYETVPEDRVEGIRVTGSGSRTIAKVLGLFFENEFKAIARMIGDVLSRRCARSSKSAARAPSTSAWNGASIVDYDRSGECAAGTGSFLDQQALRMQYSVEEVGALVCDGRLRGAHRRPLLGVRQERHDPRPAEGLLAGRDSARAVRRRGAQFQELHREGPAGGGAGGADRRGVAERGRDARRCARRSRWPKATCSCPAEYAWCGAIGAAMLEAEEPRKRSILRDPPPAPARSRRDACRIRRPLSTRERGAVARPRGRVRAARRATSRFRPTWGSTSARFPPTWW